MCYGRRAIEQNEHCPGLMGLDDAAKVTREPRVGIIQRIKKFFNRMNEQETQLQNDTMDFTDDDWKRLKEKGR